MQNITLRIHRFKRKLSEHSTIHFNNLSFQCSNTLCVVPITSTSLFFFGSNCGKSYLLDIKEKIPSKFFLSLLMPLTIFLSFFFFFRIRFSVNCLRNCGYAILNPHQFIKALVTLQTKGPCFIYGANKINLISSLFFF